MLTHVIPAGWLRRAAGCMHMRLPAPGADHLYLPASDDARPTGPVHRLQAAPQDQQTIVCANNYFLVQFSTLCTIA